MPVAGGRVRPRGSMEVREAGAAVEREGTAAVGEPAGGGTAGGAAVTAAR